MSTAESVSSSVDINIATPFVRNDIHQAIFDYESRSRPQSFLQSHSNNQLPQDVTQEPQPGLTPKNNHTDSPRTGRVIKGSPKTLCLPTLCKLDDLSGVLIVRQECPWDTYRPGMRCDIAGKVIIASRRSNRSRVQAIRQYSESDAKGLIQRFERLDHANVLLTRDCYLYGPFLYALVEDLPLTLEHLVSCPRIYPTEQELGSIMFQVRRLAVVLSRVR